MLSNAAIARTVLLLAATAAFLTFLYFQNTVSHFYPSHLQDVPIVSNSTYKHIIVASMKQEDTSWVSKQLPDWGRSIYLVDDPTSSLTVSINKGREAMVYLTYIIDHYPDFPQYMVFVHSQRYQYHNDDPLYDNVPAIKNLRLHRLKEEGYLNLRCTWALGCPAELYPKFNTSEEVETETRLEVELGYGDAWRTFFPGKELPQVVAVSCCAQFAVTREQILRIPNETYELMRRWLTDTTYPDGSSGRVFEYLWHVMFDRPPVHCPNVKECYCKTWGHCNLTCTEEECQDRYSLPEYTLPEGWPEVGWGD